ncbi:MAG: TraM recognition domain-containing protein [Bacteriovorax sp.]|nr:TraM recognition domain-containing protein [Bacteriovorax sp.]
MTINNSSNKSSGASKGTIDPFTELLSTLMEDLIGLTTKGLSKLIELLIDRISKRNQKKVILESFIITQKTTLNPQSIGYSVSNKRDVLFTEIPMERHNLILGGSGFGKSNLISLIMEYKIQVNSPLIYFDPKGSKSEILQFRNLNKYYGKECLIFSELYPDEMSYNPFNGLNNTQRTQIIMRSLEWSEGEARYYKDQSQRALMQTMAALTDEKTLISLPNIYRHLAEHRDHKETSGLLAQLEIIMASPFGRLLEDNGRSIDMRNLRKSKKSLYVGLSTQGYGSVAKTIGKLIINDIQMTSHMVGIEADDSHDSIRDSFAVFIDEAGSILYEDFIDFLNKNRSSGYQTFIAMQTPADAEKIGPQFKDHLLELCSNWFILKQGNNDYASAISESIGTFKTVKRSAMTVDNIESERGSVRDVREYLCPPQVIKDLEIGQCIMLTKSPSSLHFLKLRDIRKSDVFGYKNRADQDHSLKILIHENPILKASIVTKKVEIKKNSDSITGIENFYKE